MTYDEFKRQFNISLNPQQEAAVRETAGNVLLLAVPGSGKTTVLINRLGWLVRGLNTDPREILTMTYTTAAARDMKQRFLDTFGRDDESAFLFQTINAVCFRIYRLWCSDKGVKQRTVINEDRKTAMLSRLYREINGRWPSEAEKRTLATAVSYARNMLLTREEIEAYSPGVDGFAKIYEAYCRALEENSLMDFDDQLTEAYRILLEDGATRERYRHRWRHICVDEAQDTSKLQHEIIRLLTGDDGRVGLFMVGDEDQSIYGFRAAYPQGLYDFTKLYPGGRVMYLETNYRSTKSIVRAAELFIGAFGERHEKRIIARRDTPGAPVEFRGFNGRAEQYEALVALAQSGGETAVLYHDNDSAVPLADALDRAGVPYRLKGTEALFFSNAAVCDILGIIRFILSGCADREFFKDNYYKLGLYLNTRQAEHILRSCPAGKSLISHTAGINPDRDPVISENAVRNARLFEIEAKYFPSYSAAEAVRTIRKDLGYDSYMRFRGISDTAAGLLMILAVREESPESLLRRVSELNEMISRGSDAGSLTLSTVHSAKGLEFDSVVIIDAVDGVFPRAEESEDREAYLEERRLFFVAMTRAREKLTVYSYADAECSFPAELKKLLNDPPRRQLKPPKPGRGWRRV